MSGSDERPDDRPRDVLEERLRRALRVIAGGVLLLLIVVLSLADTFGRSAGWQASETIFFGILGAFLLIAGVEGAAFFARWFKR